MKRRPTLLAGGNPQIPKAEGDAPVQRYLDIHEDGAFDEGQLAEWLRQAAAFPGWVP